MKKYIKLILTSLLCSSIFIACTNDESSIELVEIHQSNSMQSALNQLRNHYNEDGSPNQEMNPTNNLVFDFCFEFVYPLSLSYNNEVIVTVNSIDELVSVIINSSEELYITGVIFPFDVILYDSESNELVIQTINNEEEFSSLITNCYFNDPCICTEEYDPVCVEIIDNDSEMVVLFPNLCYAFCEGFTESDLVNCENNTECTIYDLEIITGECNDDNTYNMTINFQYEEIGEQEFFDLYARNDELIGYFPLSSLPLTIINFPSSGEEYDFVKVCINDNPDCCKEIEWLPPNCSGPGFDCETLEANIGDVCEAEYDFILFPGLVNEDCECELPDQQGEYCDMGLEVLDTNGEFNYTFSFAQLPESTTDHAWYIDGVFQGYNLGNELNYIFNSSGTHTIMVKAYLNSVDQSVFMTLCYNSIEIDL